MHVRRSGDPIRVLRQTVDNSLLGRLLGLGDRGPMSEQDQIPAYDPNRSVYSVDPAGLPSTTDQFLENFTPLGDIGALIASADAAKDGRYVEAALAPLFMILPSAMSKRLRKSVDELRKLNMSKLGDIEKYEQRLRIMGDLDRLNREALQFRNTNPQAYDQAIREVAREANPQERFVYNLSSDDAAADAFVSGRARELGYTGYVPDPSQPITGSRNPLGGPPISTLDKRGMELVEGTPSERAVRSALLHQSHGSAGKTGLVDSDQMQRMAQDVPLVRTPVHTQKYRVIRDGDEIMVKSGDIEEGDIIRSLSQESSGRYGGKDRIVSFSGTDLESNRKGFGIDFNEKAATADAMDISVKELDEGLDSGMITAEDLIYPNEFGPGPLSMSLDEIPDEPFLKMSEADMALMGNLYDPRRPSFKIINTKGMPITRADMMKPSSGKGAGLYQGEDEFGVSARQAFNVLQTGLTENDVPFMLLSPNRRFRYDRGGKFKILKK